MELQSIKSRIMNYSTGRKKWNVKNDADRAKSLNTSFV